MSDHFSFPSCFHPPTTTDHNFPAAEAAAAAAATPPISVNPNLTTCLYHTDVGLVTLTWSRNFLGRSLHLHLHLDGGHFDTLSSPPPSLSTPSFHLHIKPFIFWRKQGSKKLNLNHHTTTTTTTPPTPTPTVQIFWDLTRAKFGSGSGPEPQSGFYIAVVIDGDMTLLVGDSPKEAYTKTKAAKPKRTTQTLLLRREHVLGNKLYTTKATFGGKTREITIECNVNDDPRLCFSIDSKRVLQIKRLKWKFRGNERIEVDGVPIQVSWDVYNWLFEDVIDGHAVFMFRFEKLIGFDEEDGLMTSEVNEKNGLVLCGFGMNGFERKKMKKSLLTTRSSSSSSMSSASSSGCSSSVMEWASMEEKELEGTTGFSLLVYAWRS